MTATLWVCDLEQQARLEEHTPPDDLAHHLRLHNVGTCTRHVLRVWRIPMSKTPTGRTRRAEVIAGCPYCHVPALNGCDYIDLSEFDAPPPS